MIMSIPLNNPIPHQHLVDELIISLIPINLQLPTVHALVKWLHNLHTPQEPLSPINWIISLHPNKQQTHLFEKKILGLKNLQQLINDIEEPVRDLFTVISEFSSSKEVQSAIYLINQSYNEIPYIEGEVALLSNDCNVLEHQELFPILFYYLEKVNHFVLAVEKLKTASFAQTIDTLSNSMFQNPLEAPSSQPKHPKIN